MCTVLDVTRNKTLRRIYWDNLQDRNLAVQYDFSDCCEINNVSKSCLAYCSVLKIIEGTSVPNPETCQTDLPVIRRFVFSFTIFQFLFSVKKYEMYDV